MEEIIGIISDLERKGYAYAASNGDVYFRTGRFEEYGKLSHQPLDDLEAGARIDVSELKEDPMDFALWKAAKPGEPSWPSPGATAAPAGISSAPPWPGVIWGIPSTFTAADRT